MCGIAGILRVWTPAERELALRTPHVRAIPEAWLDVLDESIKHRGPDGQGRFRDRAIRSDGCVVDVALVHRRLSIIDHVGGHQPMLSLGRGRGVVRAKNFSMGDGLGLYERDVGALSASEGWGAVAVPEASGAPGPLLTHGASVRSSGASSDRSDRVCVVFNGCIYNHRELRAELERAGHVFSTDHSDTEVLVHGWSEWGVELFDRLNGMFGFGVWDRTRGSLALARDSMGEKPVELFHASIGASWVNAFSSFPPGATRLPTLLGPNSCPVPASGRAEEWLWFGYKNEPPILGSRGLPPGASVVFGPARNPLSKSQDFETQTELLASELKYFGPMASDGKLCRLSRHEMLTADEADELLRAAVCSRVEADTPLGCFLSGGVDSSLVAWYAKSRLGDLRTFTVAMPEGAFDESSHAEAAARFIGSKHTTLPCKPNPCADLIELVHRFGVPFGDSSALPTLWVSRAAREHVSVALSGDGGDELFAGYERYLAADRLSSGVPGLSRLARLLDRGAKPRSRRSKLARALDACGNAGYPDIFAIFPTSMLRKVLSNPGAYANILNFGRKPPMTWTSGLAVEVDVLNYLPDDLLRKVDGASMAVALEVRAPMLELSLVKACLSADMNQLMPHNERKGLLRQVARRYLPSEIVDRPKMGFAIPIGEWFRSDYGGLRTMLLDHLNSTEPFGPPSLGIDLNMKFVRQMLDEHLGTGMSGRVVRDHSQRLYMLLVLSIWSKWMGSLGR